MKLLAPLLVSMLAAPLSAGMTQTGVTLGALTVPDAKLPTGCRLHPPTPPPTRITRGETTTIKLAPAPYFPYPSNPWTGTDRRLVVESRKRIDPFGVPDGPPPMLAERTKMEGAWVANVREGYHAGYVSPDNITVDVTAIRFDNASFVTTSRTVPDTHEPHDVSDRVTLGAMVVVVRANSKTECFSAVDAYIRGLQ
jgi:hypothetical protein